MQRIWVSVVPMVMNVFPGEYVIVPDVGRCRVIAQHESRRIVFQSPEGDCFRMDVQDLVSKMWTDFERELEQELDDSSSLDSGAHSNVDG